MQGRSHDDFVVPLIHSGLTRTSLYDSFCEGLEAEGHPVVEVSEEEALGVVPLNRLVGSRLLPPEECLPSL
jgi:hypothetical protein